jgi:ligand-binding SRPBCC domain-containing protein
VRRKGASECSLFYVEAYTMIFSSTAAVTTRTAVITPDDISSLADVGSTPPFQSVFAESRTVHTHSFLRDSLKTIEGGKLKIARGSLK